MQIGCNKRMLDLTPTVFLLQHITSYTLNFKAVIPEVTVIRKRSIKFFEGTSLLETRFK